MDINIGRILSNVNRQSDVQEALGKQKTPMNQSKFISMMATKPNSVVVENYGNILDNPYGLKFLHHHIHTEAVSVPDLDCLICEIDKRIPKEAKDETLSKLKASAKACKEFKGSTKAIKESVLYRLALKDFNSQCIYESMIVDELDIVSYNINTSPEAVTDYARLLQDIELRDYSSIAESLPDILTKNTEMLIGLYVTFSGRTGVLFTSIPMVIVNRIVKDGTKKQQLAYIRIIDRNISMIRDALKDCESKHYKLLSEYLKNLYSAKDLLVKQSSVAMESSDNVYEGIADMQPDIVSSDREGPVYDLVWKAREVATDMIYDDEEVISNETLTKLAKLNAEANKVYGVTEGKLGKFVSKNAHKVEKAGRKAVSKIRQGKDDIKRAKVAADKAVAPAINLINKSVNEIKSLDKKERRERIITGEFKLKLKKTLGRAIKIVVAGSVATAAWGPIVGSILALIGIITGLAIDDALDAKVRRELLAELETELSVVNEKLDDSKSDGNKNAKYQLIRIKKALESDIDRVRYRLKSSETHKKYDSKE